MIHNTINIKKGFNINISGAPQKTISDYHSTTYAISPLDFIYYPPIPKIFGEIGQNVLAGEPLFCDKNNEEMVITSPVSGESISINRGEKRAINSIVLLADSVIEYKKFNILSNNCTRQNIIDLLLESGCWLYFKQRPYNVIANPLVIPKAIYISCFDTTPLSVDLELVIKGNEHYFQSGISALKRLTHYVHLGINSQLSNSTFTQFQN